MEFFPQAQPFLCNSNCESQIADEIRAVIKKCLARIRSWPAPRNWSRADWFDEAEDVAKVAAWQAVSDYTEPAASALPNFVRQRVLSTVRTRYRQEYLYGMRFGSRFIEEDADSDVEIAGQRSPYNELVIQPVANGDLNEALARLSGDHRNVIEQIFCCGRTEAEVAKSFGLSQRGVSKRKQAALRSLRDFLQENEKSSKSWF